MSALAKVFVVFNLILSLVFFGTAATLFLTRQDMKVQYETYVAQAEDDLKALTERNEEQDRLIDDLRVALNNVEGSEVQLASQLEEKKKELSQEKTRANRAEDQRETAQREATQAMELQKEKERINKDLLARLEQANEKRDEALGQRQQAEEERNRIKRDLDAVQQELQVARVEYKELEEKFTTMETTLTALVAKYGEGITQFIATPQIDAQVDAVDADNRLVVLSAGRDQKVQPGYEFQVYRDDQFIGKVRVTQVFTDLSGAKVEFTHNGAQIRRGDKATTTLFRK